MLRWQKIVVGIEAAILLPLGVSAASAGSNSPQTATRRSVRDDDVHDHAAPLDSDDRYDDDHHHDDEPAGAEHPGAGTAASDDRGAAAIELGNLQAHHSPVRRLPGGPAVVDDHRPDHNQRAHDDVAAHHHLAPHDDVAAHHDLAAHDDVTAHDHHTPDDHHDHPLKLRQAFRRRRR